MAQDKNLGNNSKDQKASVAPSISLPKGGGAIRGMGEKFAANPVTGTGSMTVPIATSPGRSGFGPQLTLSYDSGAGNGPFGFGWSLSLPAITRKTEKGLPQYRDAEESDVFILSGAEDLVPELKKDAAGEWVIAEEPRTADGVTYLVRRYRPRIEGLFARIERWTRVADPRDVHWRSLSRDNILTLYGKDSDSRIADPEDSGRIFSWLICETRDDKGNAVVYEYKPEDSVGVEATQAHERNRTPQRRSANRYLKRIRYGNRTPLLDNQGRRPIFLNSNQIQNAGWLFEVVFDYGEHDANTPKPDDASPWTYRDDPFSSYRAGFEVRTYRLCQRVLMFHHFEVEDEAGVGNDCLVRSTDFTYSHEQDPTNVRNPVYTFLLAVTQTGYKRHNGGYLKRNLPPVEFKYSQPIVQDTVQDVDAESLENLPMGLDGTAYQWTDLHGEGIPGILTEQGGAWFYKRNLSPLPIRDNGTESIEARLAPIELVAVKPNLALAGGAQFMDLAGDGQPDLVVLDGPMPGLYEHDGDEGWQPFRSFTLPLNRDTRDANLKFVDLDGDGHADVLITEQDALVWHASLAEEGFGPARRVHQALDEEKGPRLVFADGTQSIYLADLSGDGLTDLVRIRNGEVCYWPNMGYGRFGAKVTMDNAPWFDAPDLFDQKRIRLADIDGTGTTDIIYLHRDGVRLYFNQSGNSWSAPQTLRIFPRVDDLVNIVPTDLLGNGTACLVWSSPLQGDAQRQMRYVNLMGGKKPHLLVKTVNNLGAETEVQYASSTKFYLQDKLAGKPWITKLPFPVHCVEKVTVRDKWRNTSFSTTYSYHHGYFDGIEREFRGFGRVEQVDVENYGEFAQGNEASPYITDDQTLYQPPVKTVTWFHTGAFLGRERILSYYEREYFPNWFEDLQPGRQVLGDFEEDHLPKPDLNAEELTAEEWREALRACKGMTLRQEVYELDVDALERGEHLPVKLFSTAYHNCHIRRVQPRADNPHAVFLVTESEAITYHYELDLRPDTLRSDPRIAHTLNLKIDEYGNALQSVAVVYPRLGRHVDNTLPAGTEDLIATVQRELHLAYTETRYTNDVNEPDNYRLRMPCEVLTYELTGISPQDVEDITTPDPRDERYFALDELRRYRLSDVHQTTGEAVVEIAYHQIPNRTAPQKRLVEHVRTLYFKANLQDPEPFGDLNRLGITYETYKLALTDDLLNAVFGPKLTQDVRADLTNNEVSGYLSGTNLATRFGATATAGQYWIRSGIAGFEPDAAQHFYLPERYIDPFDKVTTLKYDKDDLYIESSSDPLGNTVTVKAFDFRVLAPRELKDINDNLSEVVFDVLGMPVAMAIKGKGSEGDNLSDFDDALINPEPSKFIQFFTGDYDKTAARGFLGNATARYLYYLGEEQAGGQLTYGNHPACAVAVLREKHVTQLGVGEESLIQSTFEYSDGMGTVLVKKVQAEPKPGSMELQWVATGKTILNNKCKPVKQYEPYFSQPEIGHRFEEPAEVGVTPVMYYDAPGRLVRTELPDGSFSKVEFTPWDVVTYDPNDTAFDPDPAERSDWYKRRKDPTHPQFSEFNNTQNQRTAELVEMHAHTPASTFLDSLGREVIGVAHNKFEDSQGTLHDEKYVTFTKLDAEGKPLWVRDARGNLVMQYITPPVPDSQTADLQTGFVPCYDIAGNLLFQHSMDAGDRWMLNDAVGKPMYGWDSRGHMIETGYDPLRRPVEVFVSGGDDIPVGQRVLAEKIVYGESQGSAKNHRGTVFQHFDGAGIVTNAEYDFKGNLKETRRKLVKEYKKQIDWNQPPADDEVFTATTQFDALNRPVLIATPHNANIVPSEIRPIYNEANLLNEVRVKVRGAAETAYVKNINYNAKGQRELIEYGNGASTTYEYDPDTFRLIHLRTTRQSDNARLQDLFYTYDPVGNITEIRDDAQQTIYFNNAQIAPVMQYTYDAIYRLIQAKGREHIGHTANNLPEHRPELKPRYDFNDSTRMSLRHPNDWQAMRDYTESYEYDAVGNILKMIHSANGGSWTRRYQYENTNNRLRSTSLPGDPNTDNVVLPVRYKYDPHGSMTKMPHLPLMRWDYLDQLQATSRQVVNNGTPETTFYVYDASGERVRKVTERQNGTRKNERTYLGGFEVYREYDGGGTSVSLERESLHVIDDQQRIALLETRTQGNDGSLAQLIRYQFGNHLGSASLELDETGQIISHEEYYPYGSTSYQVVRSGLNGNPRRYRYVGKERDQESGLCYHGARCYAPWLGRWTSCDPAGVVDGTNLYVYSRSSPVVFQDTTGMRSTKSKYDVVNEIASSVQKQYKVFLDEAIASGFNPQEVGTAAGKKLQDWLKKAPNIGPQSVEYKFVKGYGPRIDVHMHKVSFSMELKSTDKAAQSAEYKQIRKFREATRQKPGGIFAVITGEGVYELDDFGKKLNTNQLERLKGIAQFTKDARVGPTPGGAKSDRDKTKSNRGASSSVNSLQRQGMGLLQQDANGVFGPPKSSVESEIETMERWGFDMVTGLAAGPAGAFRAVLDPERLGKVAVISMQSPHMFGARGGLSSLATECMNPAKCMPSTVDRSEALKVSQAIVHQLNDAEARKAAEDPWYGRDYYTLDVSVLSSSNGRNYAGPLAGRSYLPIYVYR